MYLISKGSTEIFIKVKRLKDAYRFFKKDAPDMDYWVYKGSRLLCPDLMRFSLYKFDGQKLVKTNRTMHLPAI